MPLGSVDLFGVAHAGVVDIVRPLRFGLVLIVTMVESTGMFLAFGEVCGRPVRP